MREENVVDDDFEAINVRDGKIVSIKPRQTYRPLLAAAGKVTKSDPDGFPVGT